MRSPVDANDREMMVIWNDRIRSPGGWRLMLALALATRGPGLDRTEPNNALWRHTQKVE